MESTSLASIETSFTRLGVVLSPSASPLEAEGILNPASARTRDGKLLLYPRVVAAGNTSRVGLVEAQGPADALTFERLGFVLEPAAPYELRSQPGGYGCEDPRVTFIPALDRYVMAYTAYGPEGPRIAIATSSDAYHWERLGLAQFAPGLPNGEDKDGVFFPEPVRSPSGVLSLAMYHRPMLHISAVDGNAAVPIILDMPPCDRECTRIGYIPFEPVQRDLRNLLSVTESTIVLEPGPHWGRLKTGGGTPPVRLDEGWFSLYHAVDASWSGERWIMKYRAGVVIHDIERPDVIRYRSPDPVFSPETPDELRGVVNNVVFPTAIDTPPGSPPRTFDVYYGMADARIGRVRCDVGASALAKNVEESAA
jgi:beta-1,2-mannobiose phosphorylase / 1,2-beta-oligomannan phosphorylase